MHSRSAFAWLLRKEWRALMASTSWWLMLILIGPLVGVSFISATRSYAELSVHDAAAGAGEAFSPLIGIWAPTFSACELAAAFLLPFVAIRLAAGDRLSGALKIELQRPLTPLGRIIAKAVVLIAGWGIASMAPLMGVGLWRWSGGSIHAPELLTVAAGHVLNAVLTISLASAAATITDHPSTAAIVTLGVTVGTWIISFVAAVHGGIWERAAEYTPTAMVAGFQHGLVRMDVILAALTLSATGLWLAAIWMQIGLSVRRRAAQSIVLSAAACAVLGGASLATISWDTSENRMNSFARADERVLRDIEEPLRITAYLAPEDPRRSDLERQALSKLRRVMRDFDVRYVATTSTGLFEQTSERYGEIHYRLGQRESVSRSTTAEGVLDSVYTLAGRIPTESVDDDEGDRGREFRGHPLATRPAGSELVFYGAWPVVALLAALRQRRRGS